MKKLLNTKLKDMKAITLIALVVTIVTLIVLAGVLISLTLGDNGIFQRAKKAKEDYANAAEYEETEIAKMSNEIDNYSNSGLISTRNEKIEDYRSNMLCEFIMNSISEDVILDNSGNNNNAAITGTGYEKKQENEVNFIRLDGSTYARTGEFSQLEGNKEITLSLWFRTSNSANAFICMFGNDNGEKGGIPPKIRSNGKLDFETGCDFYSYHPYKDLVTDGEWHFVCVTFDQHNIVLYLDNKVLYAEACTLNLIDPKLTIGSALYETSGKFVGDITNVRLYNKGLNFEEVYKVYQNTKI